MRPVPNRRIEIVNKKTFRPAHFITRGNQADLNVVRRACGRIDSELEDCRYWWGETEVYLTNTTGDVATVRIKSDDRLLSEP